MMKGLSTTPGSDRRVCARALEGVSRRTWVGLRAKFNLLMLVIAAIGVGLFALAAEPLVNAVAREEVLQSSRIMMESAAGARKYTSEQDRAILKPQIGDTYPQSVSAYAAKRNFDVIHDKFPDYMYREAALNPSNPQDRASDWEQTSSTSSGAHPDKKEISVERATATGAMLELARPLVNKPACLECHNTAATAPASMVALYGSENGFGWKAGEIIGAQIVSVPMSASAVRAEHIRKLFLLPFLGFLALLFISMNVLLHFVVIRPMEKIAENAEAVSMGKIDTPEIHLHRRDQVRPARSVLQPDAAEPCRSLQDARRVSEEGALTDCYFLSYSRSDQDFALRFATDLRAREVAIWIDQLDIRPSEHWDRAIERAVRDCCGLVVILSPRSVESDNVADEISYAIDRGKPVLPVMIERCPMPLRITRMQMIDATGDYDRALQQCLEVIASKDGFEKPVSRPAPVPAPKGITDPDAIRNAKKELTDILGPIAAIVVDKAAQRANSLDDFYAQLADRIPSEADRQRFLGGRGKPAAPATAKAPPQPPAPKPSGSTIAQGEIDRLAEILTPFLGPMAPIVARRESAGAASAADLRQRLASLIHDKDEREDFLRRAETKS